MARVLIVDDDPKQLDLRRLLLVRTGHEVYCARSTQEALDLLPRACPHVVVTDLRVPKLRDGLSLIRQAHGADPRPRIFVLSGWPLDLDGCAEEVMVDEIFSKPVRIEELARAIGEASAAQP